MSSDGGSADEITTRALPGGPADGEAISTEPVRGIDLARFAAISARVDEKAQSVRAVLSAEGLDEQTWLEAQRVWLIRIAAALMRQDAALAVAYDARYVEAQDALGRGEAPLDVERHARIAARLADGHDGAVTLRREGVSLARFARAERRRVAEHVCDPAAAARFAALVAAERGST